MKLLTRFLSIIRCMNPIVWVLLAGLNLASIGLLAIDHGKLLSQLPAVTSVIFLVLLTAAFFFGEIREIAYFMDGFDTSSTSTRYYVSDFAAYYEQTAPPSMSNCLGVQGRFWLLYTVAFLVSGIECLALSSIESSVGALLCVVLVVICLTTFSCVHSAENKAERASSESDRERLITAYAKKRVERTSALRDAHAIRERIRAVYSDYRRESSGSPAIISIFNQTLRQIDTDIMPGLVQISRGYARVQRLLDAYDQKRWPLPDPQILTSLRDRAEKQQKAIQFAAQELTNAEASLALIASETSAQEIDVMNSRCVEHLSLVRSALRELNPPHEEDASLDTKLCEASIG